MSKNGTKHAAETLTLGHRYYTVIPEKGGGEKTELPV